MSKSREHYEANRDIALKIRGHIHSALDELDQLDFVWIEDYIDSLEETLKEAAVKANALLGSTQPEWLFENDHTEAG